MSSFELGWAARPFKEQFPHLTDEQATHFDKDNEALMRLRIRGYLTDSAQNAAVKKIGKALSADLKAAAKPFAEYGEDYFDKDNKGIPFPDEQGIGWVYLSYGHFRALRAALNPSETQT